MTAKVNGVVLNERISNKLANLQDGYAAAIISGLDEAFGFLLENTESLSCSSKELLNILSTLHNAKMELLALIPQKEEKGDKNEKTE